MKAEMISGSKEKVMAWLNAQPLPDEIQWKLSENDAGEWVHFLLVIWK